jgi:hypothetical protein
VEPTGGHDLSAPPAIPLEDRHAPYQENNAGHSEDGRRAHNYPRFRSHGKTLTLTVVGAPPKVKKADVVEHPLVFDHVGLLVNGSPGTAELPFI